MRIASNTDDSMNIACDVIKKRGDAIVGACRAKRGPVTFDLSRRMVEAGYAVIDLDEYIAAKGTDLDNTLWKLMHFGNIAQTHGSGIWKSTPPVDLDKLVR